MGIIECDEILIVQAVLSNSGDPEQTVFRVELCCATVDTEPTEVFPRARGDKVSPTFLPTINRLDLANWYYAMGNRTRWVMPVDR